MTTRPSTTDTHPRAVERRIVNPAFPERLNWSEPVAGFVLAPLSVFLLV